MGHYDCLGPPRSPRRRVGGDDNTCSGFWSAVVLPALLWMAILPLAEAQQRNNYCLPGPVSQPSPGNSTAGIGWMNAHNRLVGQVQQANNGPGWDLIFYGDSITENWSGYSTGRLWTPSTGIPDVFQRYFGNNYRSGILGIAGDQCMNLLWRMQNGEMPERAPRVVVLLIGTNDLMSASCNDGGGQDSAVTAEPNNIYMRVQEILDLMHSSWPDTHIILMGPLPRGASYADNTEAYRWPNQYTQPMQRLNELLQVFDNNDYRVHFVDCGTTFRTTPLSGDYLGDGTHPNARGAGVLAQCIQPYVQAYVNMNPGVRPQQAARVNPQGGAQNPVVPANPLDGGPIGDILRNLPRLPPLLP